MNCSDVHRVLPDMDDGLLNSEFEAHLRLCPECSALVSDLKVISSEARQLAASEEPSQALWFRIADELRAEGLIREPQTEPAGSSRPYLITTTDRSPFEIRKQRSWSSWWLVPVTAVLLAAGAYILKPKPAGDVAQQTVTTTPTETASTSQATRSTHRTAPNSTPSSPEQVPTQAANFQPPSFQDEPQDDDELMQVVSQRAPTMRAAYENELRSVNSYISDARAYAQQNPNDEDARRNLMDAYAQKQMLYQMALSNIQ